MVYILVEKDPIKPVGIFSTEAGARSQAVEGEYLIIPVENDRLYVSGIVSEAMAGAITIKALGTELSEAVSLVLGRLDTIDGNITTIQNQISAAQGILTDFETRITALENP